MDTNGAMSPVRAAFVLIFVGVLSGCATVPLDSPKPSSTAIADTSATHFGQAEEGWRRLHGGQSGFFPFVNGMDALGAFEAALRDDPRAVSASILGVQEK